ncbi:hypothetical protein BD309DRAFT_1083644 [Dichomitus squalens]|nr:hypothetical protein BD309DRAFT_1083644 [Dichomitus squalens]
MDAPARKQTRGKSFLTRKATKKHEEPHAQNGHATRSASTDTQERDPEAARPTFKPFAISIIPDPLNELPTWYHREVETATASAAQFRVKYPLHNPSGPRWYRNHHLLPPTVDGRPPSVFSPSFPPMASAPERGQDPSGMAGPSRTPSGSPLPTPSSSQIRIQEPFHPRVRKVSQTTNQGVDLANGADPNSPDGNHHSPYDPPESPTSPGPTTPNYFNYRPRRSSMTHGNRHRTTAPSPLSQSTSAVHLHAIDPAQIQLPRKLSKRRKPFHDLFSGPGVDGDSLQAKDLRRQSAMAPSMTSLPSLQPSLQKSRRGSVLGRLVKRFSVLRKADKRTTQNGLGSEWQHQSSLETGRTQSPISPQAPMTRQRTSSHISKSPEPPKRVPPPSIEAVPDARAPGTEGRRSSESLSVLEMPTSGRLTVANPDDPSSSGEHTPVQAAASLPEPGTPTTPPPGPASEKDLPLPDIPRTESPLPISPQIKRYTLTDPPVQAPSPPSSPPLPDLPPPTPAQALQSLTEVSEPDSSPSPSTVVLPASPRLNGHERHSVAATSQASTVGPLPLASPEEIALARASMFVNPPTPYAAPAHLVMPPSVVEVQEPARSSSKRADRSPTKAGVDRSPTKSKDTSRSKSIRETETFKLVRSASGTMQQAEVIMGMGEQWELVGASSESPKKSSKSKDKEREREKDKERAKEKAKSSDHDREHAAQREDSRRHRDRSSSEDGESRHKRHPSVSGRDKPPSVNTVRSTQTPVSSRRSVKKPSEHEESRSVKATSAIPVIAVSPVQAHEQHHREHHLSTTPSAPRPTSELHSAADWSSVRAKDAWEMERLWKARSMAYGPDGIPIVSTPATIGSDSRPSTFISTELQRVTSIPSVAAVAEMQKPSSAPPIAQSYGSSHTYMVVQTPYQVAQGHPPYSPYTSPPPQNLAMSPAQQFYRHAPYSSPEPLSHNPLPNPPRLSAYQPSPVSMTLANPLPDPPRLSSYTPAPLPASLANGNGSPTGWSHSNTH